MVLANLVPRWFEAQSIGVCVRHITHHRHELRKLYEERSAASVHRCLGPKPHAISHSAATLHAHIDGEVLVHEALGHATCMWSSMHIHLIGFASIPPLMRCFDATLASSAEGRPICSCRVMPNLILNTRIDNFASSLHVLHKQNDVGVRQGGSSAVGSAQAS